MKGFNDLTGQSGTPKVKVTKKMVIGLIVIVVGLICAFELVGINNAGHITVVQYPWGSMNVVTDPGWYPELFGKTEVYRKEGTYSFIVPTPEDEKTGQAVKPTKDEITDSIITNALLVRYNDGGTGHIYGKARFRMPALREDILKIHYAFRDYDHLSDALFKVTTQNSMNLTAALMSSEESYTTTKEKFQRWAEEQMVKGPYETQLLTVKIEGGQGRSEEVQKATIKHGDDGKPVHGKSPFNDYKIQVTQVQITNWSYEAKTLEQIQKKRNALMSIVQAKAEAEESQQKKITAEAKGQQAVMEAKYVEEVEKTKAEVVAQREKSVAVIGASKTVEVNKQKLEAAKLDQMTAEKEKLAAIERGKGDAEARRLKMEADNALEAKLKAYVEVNKNYADAIKDYKGNWVPEIVMGQKDGKSQNGAQELIDLLTAKTAKDLQLDLSMPKKGAQKEAPKSEKAEK